MIKAPTAILSAILCVMLAAPAAAQATFGAIAWSDTTGRWGYSYAYNEQSAAEQRAMDECGVNDCEIRTWFRNACGALVVSGNGHGASWGTDVREAQSKAMDLCRGEGNTNCQLAASTCSSQ